MATVAAGAATGVLAGAVVVVVVVVVVVTVTATFAPTGVDGGPMIGTVVATVVGTGSATEVGGRTWARVEPGASVVGALDVPEPAPPSDGSTEVVVTRAVAAGPSLELVDGPIEADAAAPIAPKAMPANRNTHRGRCGLGSPGSQRGRVRRPHSRHRSGS